jgi:hypothetical protein
MVQCRTATSRLASRRTSRSSRLAKSIRPPPAAHKPLSRQRPARQGRRRLPRCKTPRPEPAHLTSSHPIPAPCQWFPRLTGPTAGLLSAPSRGRRCDQLRQGGTSGPSGRAWWTALRTQGFSLGFDHAALQAAFAGWGCEPRDSPWALILRTFGPRGVDGAGNARRCPGLILWLLACGAGEKTLQYQKAKLGLSARRRAKRLALRHSSAPRSPFLPVIQSRCRVSSPFGGRSWLP